MAPESLEEVMQAVDFMAKKYGPPAAVYFDTLARNFGDGDENSTKDMNRGISNMDAASTAFSQNGVRYVPADKTKSEIYLSAEPLFSRGQVELLDDKLLFTQLRSLERRTRRGGRDLVDHPPRGMDDVANSACGALKLLVGTNRKVFPELTEEVTTYV